MFPVRRGLEELASLTFAIVLVTLVAFALFAWSVAAQFSWWWYGGVLVFVAMVTAARTGSALRAIGLCVVLVILGAATYTALNLGLLWAVACISVGIDLLWIGLVIL